MIYPAQTTLKSFVVTWFIASHFILFSLDFFRPWLLNSLPVSPFHTSVTWYQFKVKSGPLRFRDWGKGKISVFRVGSWTPQSPGESKREKNIQRAAAANVSKSCFTEMYLSNAKIKVDVTQRVFQEKWKNEYFLVDFRGGCHLPHLQREHRHEMRNEWHDSTWTLLVPGSRSHRSQGYISSAVQLNWAGDLVTSGPWVYK